MLLNGWKAFGVEYVATKNGQELTIAQFTQKPL